MVCPCTLYGVCVVCLGTSELVGRHKMPKMIGRILDIVRLDANDTKIKMHDTPADSNNILDNNPLAKPRKQSWSYRLAVGALSYLLSMIRPDCTFAVQQCAGFCNNPSQEHEKAVKGIVNTCYGPDTAASYLDLTEIQA